jgi:hypothetical protein
MRVLVVLSLAMMAGALAGTVMDREDDPWASPSEGATGDAATVLGVANISALVATVVGPAAASHSAE